MVSGIDSYGKAAAAYARTARGEPAGGDDGGAPAVAGSSFAALLENTMGEAVAAGRTADRAAVSAVAGNAGLDHVVTAVAEAELSLQTMVAIRERVIDAYKEIMRMPI